MPNKPSKQFVCGVHQLLGSTLRDGRRERQGRIVGIDQTRDHPVIDVVWAGQAKAERIIITCDQLHELVEACLAREAAGGRQASGERVAKGGEPDSRTGSEPVLDQRYRA